MPGTSKGVNALADIPGDSSTAATLTVGGSATDSLETLGDHDWFKITLTAGQAVTISVALGSLEDSYLNIRDSNGNIIESNDDIVDGVVRGSRISFSPAQTGTYYIDVGAFNDQYTGTYTVSVQPYATPPVATNDQIADQLVSGYWGGDVHHFNATQGGTITVNISTLNASEQTLARAALQEWSDIIGVHFQEVSTGGQIVFDDSEDPSGPIAATDANYSDGITTTAHVHISTSWVKNYGTGLDTYSFQTYIHEIGHALGLGHAGDYNNTATFPYDASFLNDSWSTSIMSYFDQHQNTYFENLGFTENFAVTPMVADILAMQTLYGLSTTTRPGDTTYGYHSNAGGIYDATLYPNVAYTIFDNGGVDTLDFSGSPFHQVINLNPETFSSVNGNTGNLTIARGVTIENATGGSGDDTIIGNSANNVLIGGGGTDTVSYETATAGVTVNMALTTPQDTGGAGVDTLSGFESLIGSSFADVLIAGPTTMSINGGAGDDLIEAGPTTPASSLGMYGGDGNDIFLLGGGSEWIDGGSGFNTVDCSNSSVGVTLITNGHAGTGIDTLVNIQEVIGSNFADTLYASTSSDILIGGAGDDTLIGDAYLAGGAGNDTYQVTSAAHITENPGEGTDTVIAASDYTLGANLENLTLREMISSDPYAGAAVPPSHIAEDWSGTGNDLANAIIGNAGANLLSGMGGDDTLSGLAGADVLTGGLGNDIFRDTEAGHDGDTITDFSAGDSIVFTDATLGSFTFSLSGHTLNFTGGSLTLTNVLAGHLIASAATGGGVQLTLAGAVATLPGVGVFAGDFNGDGRDDILWRNDNGQVTDWLGTSSGGFTANSANLLASVPTDWKIVGQGDFNGDGITDILWRHDDGALTDWLGTANGGFAANNSLMASVPTDWKIDGTGDFNGDGITDILWRNDSGALTDWLGTADGNFTANNSLMASVPTDWKIDGTGDFNGDGYTDILWRNEDGTLTDWLGTPGGGFVANNSLLAQVPTAWKVVGTGDFNGDGYADILWRHDDGTLTDWLGTAGGGFVANNAVMAAVPTNWTVVETGDFNGDHMTDILWREDNGTLTDWLGQANGTFADNWNHAATSLSTDWHVQPENMLF
jgi:serralysin